MRTSDLIKLALNGLKRRKARTFLTVLGVIIGTVCIVLMFAIGLSSYQQFEEAMLSNTNLTEIEVNDYSGGSSGGGMTDSTVASIAGLPHVKAASPVISIPITMTAGQYVGDISVSAVDPKILDIDFAEGGMFSSEGMPSVVLGGSMLPYFIDPDNPPDYYDYQSYENYKPNIDMLGTDWEMKLGSSYDEENPDMPKSQVYRGKISGISKKSYSDQSYTAYMDLDMAKRMLMENRDLAEYMGLKLGRYDTLKIVVDSIENVDSVLEEVKKLGYQTYSPTEMINQMREEQGRQQSQLFAIGFISLFVSAIGIANTMYANILERRRDIGLMKVVGMKIKKIRSLFIIESAFIGLLGGAIGLAASFIAVLVLNMGGGETSFLGMYFYGGMNVNIPLWLAGAAMAIAVGTGVLAGLYPAWQATRMSPLEAMRAG